jgi:hypothetical protein
MIETPNSGGGEIAVPEFLRHPRRKGKLLSAERRAKISAALKGKPKSLEHRTKLSAAAKEREARKRIPINLPSSTSPFSAP